MLFLKLSELIQDIFGVKFAESDDMKQVVDKMIKGFENIIDNAREMVKWVKGLLKDIKAAVGGIKGAVSSYRKLKEIAFNSLP